MRRFHFSLRPVAVLRAHRELQARQALAAALGLAAAAEANLATVRARAADLERAIADGRSGGFHSDQQVAFISAYRRERMNEAEAARKLEGARREVERRREAAVEANRQMKIVASLEEKARARHRAETLRVEQLEFDERAASRAGRESAPL